MFKLLLLIGTTVVLSNLSFKRDISLKDDGKQEKFYYTLLVVFLAFFAGLRYHWNDTQTYIGGYKYSGLNLSNFTTTVDFYSDYYAYNFIQAACKTLKMDEHLYMMFYSAFYVTVYVWFLRKYAENQFPLVMFLFMVNGYTFLLAAMKQVTAVAFGLIAIDRAIRKKWISYLLLMFIAYLFHPSIVVFLVVPILINAKPWSSRTFAFVFVLFVMGVGMRYTSRLLSGFLDTSEETMLDHTVDPLRFAVAVAPMIFSFGFRKSLYEDSSLAENLMFHLHLTGVMFMFWALFGNPILFARLTDSFSVMSCISVGWMIWKIDGADLKKNEIGQWTLLVCIAYFVVSACSNYLLCSEPYRFDNQYRAISVGSFYQSLVNWVGEWI